MTELDRMRALGKALNQSELARDSLTAALSLMTMGRDPVEELRAARTAVETMHQQVKLSLIDATLETDPETASETVSEAEEPWRPWIEGTNAVE